MKKVLAIILAICMMAVFVPAFAVGAADVEDETPTLAEAIEGKQKFTSFQNSSDTIEGFAGIAQGAQVNSAACGFLDGNVYFDRPSAKTLMSALSADEVLVYVDGKLADLAPAHSRPLGNGIGGGFMFAIVNAPFTNGTASKVTFVFGNTGYYTDFTVKPNATNLAYDSAEAIIKGSKATITVTGASIAAAYKAGDAVNVELHDDHNVRNFTVESVKGNTVVFTCENFAATTKTILEIGKGTDKAFSVLVTENLPGGVVPAPENGQNLGVAYQTQPGAKAGNDMRFIFAAELSKLSAIADSAKVTVTFNKGDAVVKEYVANVSDLNLFYQVVADGEYWAAPEGCAIFGFIIRDVPTFAWTKFSVTVVDGDETLYSGYSEKDIKETVAMGGYVWLDGEENINASTGKNSGGESSIYLFDKTSAKYGFHSGGGDQTITWNYAEAKTISLYAIYSGNDSIGSNSTRHPTAWVFEGSTDGQTWNVIDDVTAPTMPANGGAGAFFKVDAPAAYQYYRITFKTQNDYFQLGEIKMYETATSVSYNFNDTINGAMNFASNPAASGAGEGLPELFDGNGGTKFGFYGSTDKVTITWSYATAQTATGYSITTGNDSTYWTRNPDSWVLYGSTDGITWVPLDEVAVGGNFSEEYMIYGIDNPAAYQYYKIEFTVANHAFQMSDLVLFN